MLASPVAAVSLHTLHDRPNLFVNPFSWHYYAGLDEALIQAAMNPDWTPSPSRISPRRLEAIAFLGGVRAAVLSVGTVYPHRNSGRWILYGMVRLLVGLLVEVGGDAIA